MTIGTRGLRAIFLAFAVVLMAGALAACDDSGGAGDTGQPAPTQN